MRGRWGVSNLLSFCLDVARGRKNVVLNETWAHLWRFANKGTFGSLSTTVGNFTYTTGGASDVMVNELEDSKGTI